MKILAALLAVLALSGCVTLTRKTHLHDLARLPQCEGVYGGSIWLGPPWLYFGSDERFHYFCYTYTKGNRYFSKRLKIPRDELRLEFETPFASYDAPGMAVVPLHGIGSAILDFTKASAPQTGQMDWMHHVPTLPAFESKL